MGLREYGRHRGSNGLPGCTLQAVQKAIASGRITVEPNGRVDAAKADLQWAAATDRALQRRTASEPVVMPAPLPLLSGEALAAPVALKRHLDGPEWPPLTEWPSTAKPTGVVIDGTGFMAAKTVREQAEAELSRLKLAAQLGKVVDADAARKTFRAAGRMHAQARESVPTQIAPLLVGKTDLREIERIIRTALREADERVAHEILALDVAIAG